ncbi:MAG: LysR family transcriptional regulator [Myxococcota bacterium]
MKSLPPSVNFSWDDVEICVLASELGSLSAVARHTSLSVATVGRRIDRLEAAIGATLFHRHPGGLSPVVGTAALLERAGEVARSMQDFWQAARVHAAGGTGNVTLSTIETIATHVLAPRLNALRRAHPGIEVTLLASHRITSLARHVADLAIRVVRPHEPDVVGRRVGTFSMSLFAHPDYIDEYGPIDADHLSAHTVVAYQQAFDRIPEQRWLLSRMEDNGPSFRVSSLAALREVIRSGVGIGILPSFMRGDEFIDCAPDNNLPARELWLVMREESRAVPRIRAVADFAAAAVQEVLVEGA